MKSATGQDGKADGRIAVMQGNPPCVWCGSEKTVRAGKRELKASVRQLFRCNDCWRRFSRLHRGDKHTHPRVVLRALELYCEGHSLDETAFILEKKHGVERSRSCLSKWLLDFDPPYRALRRMNRGHHPVVDCHVFTHREVNYSFQVHLPKLRFAKRFGGLQEFLLHLPERVPHEVFATARRCSQMKLAAPPDIRHARHNWLNEVALQALRMAASNRERHATVEGFFLSCDRNTIATEVPVWHYDKQLGSIAGHIDILQVNFGKLWVLDFKPNAAKEDPAKVATQLTMYARGLAYRAEVRLKEIRCAWFDEADCFSFRPGWGQEG